MNLPDEIKRREKRLMQMDQAKQEIEKRGKVPQAPDPTARAEDQVNLTDEESRIMKCHGGAFEQCFNAQAAVVTQASNDKQQVEPMLKQRQSLA